MMTVNQLGVTKMSIAQSKSKSINNIVYMYNPIIHGDIIANESGMLKVNLLDFANFYYPK